MAAFAAHYNFSPRRCRAYRPKTKGKVEREVRYIRTSFLPSLGSDISKISTARLNELAELWMKRVDQKMIRDFGQTRAERFEHEKVHLIDIPEQPFEYRLPELLYVNREGKLVYKTNCYSMSAQYRCKQPEGLPDLLSHKLTLKHDGKVIRTLILEADGAKKTVTTPEDELDHYKAWLQGFELEEKVKTQIREKRKRAEDETTTADPVVYDYLFTCNEDPVEVAV